MCKNVHPCNKLKFFPACQIFLCIITVRIILKNLHNLTYPLFKCDDCSFNAYKAADEKAQKREINSFLFAENFSLLVHCILKTEE